MKKLLALVLCVMMFASLSVNAFAAVTPTEAQAAAWAADVKTAITAAYDNVAAMQSTLAADKVAYSTLVQMDTTLESIVKQWNGLVNGKKLYGWTDAASIAYAKPKFATMVKEAYDAKYDADVYKTHADRIGLYVESIATAFDGVARFAPKVEKLMVAAVEAKQKADLTAAYNTYKAEVDAKVQALNTAYGTDLSIIWATETAP